MTVYTDALTLAHHHDHHQVVIVNVDGSLHLGALEIADPQGHPLSPQRLSTLPPWTRSRSLEQLAIVGAIQTAHVAEECW